MFIFPAQYIYSFICTEENIIDILSSQQTSTAFFILFSELQQMACCVFMIYDPTRAASQQNTIIMSESKRCSWYAKYANYVPAIKAGGRSHHTRLSYRHQPVSRYTDTFVCIAVHAR